MEKNNSNKQKLIVPELYFLISKFLLFGPLKETAEILVKELEKHKVLPKRIDWQGREHEQSFAELEKKYAHIGPQHLLEICCRIGPILNEKLAPSVPGIISLLGAGRQSLLRTEETVIRPRSLLDYCTRLHGKPLGDSLSRNKCNNIIKVLYGRENSGPINRRLAITPRFYEKTHLLRRTLGHLSAVYCVLFDRSGKYIITGADDLLVKLWSAIDARLLATFRGASAEITDLAINLDNTLLAAGSLDRKIRVWDLQTTGPVAVLSAHTGMITSVNFCPSPRGDLRYLVSTSTDGSIAFWQYTTQRGLKAGFASKPIQYHEKLRPGQAQMICASFSPGGMFLAAGSADHYVRIYIMSEDGPKRILETEAHTDTVDSIQWSHHGLRFISGSKDGTANLWNFESQQWKSMKLNMSDRLPSCPVPEDESKKLKVTMVSWDFSDKWVITAANDFTIKVWNPITGHLVRVLRAHTDELYVLESHPKDPDVLLSAGHDGQIIIWDIEEGIVLTSFTNFIDGQGHGGVYDAKWSPDGTMIAATDSHGHILLFGFGVGHERLKILPKELFFHTDYRPLIRDENNYVLDEQTQTAPHLMPPPFLVDIDGNPHPPILQRLVPGRENCPSEQLVPNIGPEGGIQVEEEPANVRSDLDRLIEALANRQGQDQAPDSNNDRDNQIPNRSLNNNSPRNMHRIALRRTGDVEGVRQSSGNWQRDGPYKFVRRLYVKSMKSTNLQTIKQQVYSMGIMEMDIYRREMRRRPLMINTSSSLSSLIGVRRRGRLPKKGGIPPAYRTRAVREREHIEENEREIENTESESNSSDSDSSADEEALLMSGTSSSSETESSDYSDWIADEPGATLEPPKRSKRKPVPSRVYSPESEANGTSSRKAAKKMQLPVNGEIPEAFKPPEWLSEVIPRKAPYYPQMGDEVVYLRQGHAQYLDAVRTKKVYKLNNNSEPWTYIELGAHEYCKVIGIKYEIRPPRLCCLKLGIMDSNGHLTGDCFTVKYHDMPDVLDFLVLRQTFDAAVSRGWIPGDRFRCMIGDGWWMGQIEARTALSSHFPDSLFMCFRVRWDNGEYEYMSPWDMEPIDENRLPAEIGGAVPVLPEELRATLYQPRAEEWPRGDREASCRRIITGLEHVMGLAIADPFLAPVDLNIYPQYAFVVEYPIDLSTIKARFENHFYRRITSAQFDVRYLATNAEKFNRPHSNIVKHARIITDLCLRIIRDPSGVDVGAVYHQLVDTYMSSDSENENEAGPSTSMNNNRSKGSRRSKRLQSAHNWVADCRELFEMIWQCDDSTPFREPVDIIEHPDYNQVIDTPMDLMSIREDLLGGNYTSPIEFAKDMRLIFENSRNYNTNKRSRIYSMTLRLSTLFEAYIKPILINWKSRQYKGNKNCKRVTRGLTNGTTRDPQSSDDDDDDDEDDDENPSNIPRKRGRPRRNPTSSNAVSSSMNSNVSLPGPSHIRRPGRGRPQTNNCDRSGSTSSTPSSSSSSDDSDESAGIPLSALGDGNKQRALARRRNLDSEDSYHPDRNDRKKKKRLKGNRKKIGRPKKIESTPKKYNIKRNRTFNSDDEDDSLPKKRQRKSKENNKSHNSSSDENNSSDDDDDGYRKKRRRKYESDHSYHLDLPSNKRNTSDLDVGTSNRPTRGRTRNSNSRWNRTSDSLDEDENQHEQSSSSYRRSNRNRRSRNNLSDSKSQEEQSSQSMRSRRALKKIRRDNNEEDTDDEFDGNNRTRSNRGNKISQSLSRSSNNNSIPTASASFTNSRYPHRVSSRIQNSFNSHNNALPHEVDHNYGEPGPSTLRQTRRMLSRHQRNPDELDNIDIRENESNQQLPQPSTSSRLRLRNNVNRNISNTSNTNIPPKRNHTSTSHNFFDGTDDEDNTRSRLRNRKPVRRNIETSKSESDGDSDDDLKTNQSEEDDEENGDGGGEHKEDDGGEDENEQDEEEIEDNVKSDNNEGDGSDNESDPDDNKPLQMIVTSTQRNRLHNTRSGGVAQRHYYSDEEAGPSGVTNGPRSTRKIKRLQYNEESDEDSVGLPVINYKTKRIMETQKHNGNTSSNSSNGINQLNDDSSDNENLVSISSRGRVRKLTAKARGLLKD